MADTRFFNNAGPVSVSEIASLTGSRIASGDSDRLFADVAPLESANENNVSFLDNTKYLDAFTKSRAGACFVREKFAARAPKGMLLLLTDEPYSAYALAAQRFYPAPTFSPGISPQAHISKSAAMGTGLRIGSGAVVGERAEIGDNCVIGANTVIGDGVIIGSDSHIGANCTISYAITGKRLFLHHGVHIGQDGFGFAPGPKGIVKVPQMGRVIIGDDVDIGSGTCIDRGTGPDTVIGDGCKIDNLVQIGHNVQLGRFVVIAAQCGIAGSSVIGDGTMLGGQVGIAGHLSIGAKVKLAAQAGVITDLAAGESYGGTPAVPLRNWHRQSLMLAKMVKKKELTDE